MKITSVNVRKIEKENSRMKGIVSILLDDCFAIHDIKIIEGDTGPFVAMPSRRNAVGDYRDIVHPINQETRDMFNEIIIAEYEKAEDVKPEEKAEEENVEDEKAEDEKAEDVVTEETEEE